MGGGGLIDPIARVGWPYRPYSHHRDVALGRGDVPMMANGWWPPAWCDPHALADAAMSCSPHPPGLAPTPSPRPCPQTHPVTPPQGSSCPPQHLWVFFREAASPSCVGQPQRTQMSPVRKWGGMLADGHGSMEEDLPKSPHPGLHPRWVSHGDTVMVTHRWLKGGTLGVTGG